VNQQRAFSVSESVNATVKIHPLPLNRYQIEPSNAGIAVFNAPFLACFGARKAMTACCTVGSRSCHALRELSGECAGLFEGEWHRYFYIKII
jgi:hypothetical protein